MAWKARIEFLHYSAPSFTAGRADPSPGDIIASQTLTGSGATAVRSSAAPSFDGASEGHVRVSVLSGAAIIAWGANPTAGDTRGLRLTAGEHVIVALSSGQFVSIAESTDVEAGGSAWSSENHIGEVGGNSAVAGASFVRPANTTSYASGQLVANTTVAGSVTPLALPVGRKPAGTGMIRRARLSSSNLSALNAQFRVHLFKTSPTSTVGDGGTFAGAVNGLAAIHIGYLDIILDRAFSDGAKGIGAPGVGSEIVFDCAAGSQSIYALIEARAAYTPASGETLTLALEALRD